MCAAEAEVLVSVVVDTNVLMERASLLKRLCDNLRALAARLAERGVTLVPRIVVPSIVLSELDNLKEINKHRGGPVLRQARVLTAFCLCTSYLLMVACLSTVGTAMLVLQCLCLPFACQLQADLPKQQRHAVCWVPSPVAHTYPAGRRRQHQAARAEGRHSSTSARRAALAGPRPASG